MKIEESYNQRASALEGDYLPVQAPSSQITDSRSGKNLDKIKLYHIDIKNPREMNLLEQAVFNQRNNKVL